MKKHLNNQNNRTLNALWDLADDPAVDSKLLCQLVEKYYAAPTYGLHSLPWEGLALSHGDPAIPTRYMS